MRALAIPGPNELQLVDLAMPEYDAYQALVRTEVNFFCNSTDRKIVEGHFPGLTPDMYPLLLGHENTGIVTAVGDKVTTFSPGDRVICGWHSRPEPPYTSFWGGCCEYFVVRDHLAMVNDGVADAAHDWTELCQISRKLPPDISAEAGGLLCTWREIYSAFTDFNLKPSDAILVFGVGPVGLSFINFAKNWGFRFVACVAPLSPKHEVAKRLGVDALYTPDSDYTARFLKDAGGRADAIIDAVGSMDIVNNAIGLIKNGGTVGVYGVVADVAPRLLMERAPLNFNLVFHQEPTRAYESAATEPLCQWIREGKVRVADYLTGEYALEDYAEAYAATKLKSSIKTMIRFGG